MLSRSKLLGHGGGHKNTVIYAAVLCLMMLGHIISLMLLSKSELLAKPYEGDDVLICECTVG